MGEAGPVGDLDYGEKVVGEDGTEAAGLVCFLTLEPGTEPVLPAEAGVTTVKPGELEAPGLATEAFLDTPEVYLDFEILDLLVSEVLPDSTEASLALGFSTLACSPFLEIEEPPVLVLFLEDSSPG